MKLDSYLKAERIKAKTLAEKIGVDASSISRIRHGQLTPSWKTAMKISKETGIHILLLFPKEPDV
jgi:transcriptional regulator with XRE-family HTH domain